MAVLLVIVAATAAAAEGFVASDTAFPAELVGAPEAADSRSILWSPQPFTVQVEPPASGQADPIVRRVAFPSAHPSDQTHLATVTARWFVAGSDVAEPGSTDPRPIVVLIHTLHPQTPLTTMLGTALSRQGVHALLVDLPGYGARRAPSAAAGNAGWPGIVALREAGRAVADVRRACDAAAALPGVDPDRVVLHGSSLGSFSAAVAAGLGAHRNALVLLLSGGYAAEALETGQKDAARFRAALDAAGLDARQRAALIQPLEPLRFADRLDPQTTWLLAARNDTVIAPRHADALAQAIGLDGSRYHRLAGNHYTAALSLPAVAELLVRIANADDPAAL
jgi:dienelactone hydrolase